MTASGTSEEAISNPTMKTGSFPGKTYTNGFIVQTSRPHSPKKPNKQIHNKTRKETSTHLSRHLRVSVHCKSMIMCMFPLWWSIHILALKTRSVFPPPFFETCLNYLDVIKLSIVCEDNSSKGKQNGKKRIFESICRLVLVFNNRTMFLSKKNPLKEGFYCQCKIWI